MKSSPRLSAKAIQAALHSRIDRLEEKWRIYLQSSVDHPNDMEYWQKRMDLTSAAISELKLFADELINLKHLIHA